jgi:hypothetical protein
MNTIIDQTPEEKLAMYMKLTKKELSLMLIESNKMLDQATATARPMYNMHGGPLQ